MDFDITQVDFAKGNGLVPAIIFDSKKSVPLMLGYMNKEALEQTLSQKLVVFYSRTRDQLWKKGETSGHYLHVESISVDCDADTLLVKVHPEGPVCHTGMDNCFGVSPVSINFLQELECIIHEKRFHDPEESYTARIIAKGNSFISRKIMEEAFETVMELQGNAKDKFIEESADLLYHLMVAFEVMEVKMDEVCRTLSERHKNKLQYKTI